MRKWKRMREKCIDVVVLCVGGLVVTKPSRITLQLIRTPRWRSRKTGSLVRQRHLLFLFFSCSPSPIPSFLILPSSFPSVLVLLSLISCRVGQINEKLQAAMSDYEALDFMPFDPRVKRTESTIKIKSTGVIIKVTSARRGKEETRRQREEKRRKRKGEEEAEEIREEGMEAPLTYFFSLRWPRVRLTLSSSSITTPRRAQRFTQRSLSLARMVSAR